MDDFTLDRLKKLEANQSTLIQQVEELQVKALIIDEVREGMARVIELQASLTVLINGLHDDLEDLIERMEQLEKKNEAKPY